MALVAVVPLVPAQDFDQIQLQSIQVADNIFMVAGGGGNIGVCFGDDDVLLVDTQFGELHEKVIAEVSKLSDGPIRYVVNTHWHYDHVGGNERIAEAGAVIVAHEKTRQRMMVEQVHPSLQVTIPPYPPQALPVTTFNDSLRLHVNGEDIHLTHIANAHSDADVIIYFTNADVIHTGDLVFARGFPFIDVPHDGSVEGMIAAANRLLEMIHPETKIIPGHGPLATPSDLREYRDMLVAVRDRVAGLIEEGKTLEEIQAAEPTAEFNDGWDQGMSSEQFVDCVYRSLSGPPR
jgi:glyoxylase-like metal-dependent hydrolase (beta-lactamase superfamily II)